MTTASAKAKGRRLQQQVCRELLEAGKPFGLEPDDITSRSMGCPGADILVSPAASKVFGNLVWECKNVEKLNVPTVFRDHAEKYPNNTPVLAHKRNKTEPLVTIRLADFIRLLVSGINVKGN
jgi:hypothetical protein